MSGAAPSFRIATSQIFTFDLGSEQTLDLCSETVTKALKTFLLGLYSVGDGDARTFRSGSTDDLLRAYSTEMYGRRFKPDMLIGRESLVVQFLPIELRGLAHRKREVVSADHILTLQGTATLHEIGVASLVLWLDFGAQLPFDVAALLALRDVPDLTTTVDWRCGPSNQFRLSGVFSLLDLARFAMVSLMCAANNGLDRQTVRRSIESSSPLETVHATVCSHLGGPLVASHDVEHYTIFHLHTDANRDALADWMRSRRREVRGLVTGDANWDKKADAVLDAFFTDYSFSTRDSIKWLTHPAGSAKFYSSDLETPLLTSEVLVTFEVEMMLTMKHFVYRIIRSLNSFSSASKSTYPLRSIARLRDREMRRLDEYYNFDLLRKDTTVKRLDRFKKMFGIDDLFAVAVRKFDGLNVFMATEFQDAAARRQLALTVIFGVFGAGTLSVHLVRRLIEDRVVTWNTWEQLGITGGVMAGVGLVIMLVYGRIKLR